MLTAEENELLTHVGPGTRMGGLMRRYWHPVAGVEEMKDRWTLRVRLLGEDLVLFKDRGGKLGLISENCPHRGVSLACGIPQEDGIRCPYHGWKFDGEGHCVEQPNESARNALLGKKVISGYPVQQLGGLVWAYLGPEPAPLIPRWDALVDEPMIRHIGKAVIPCNWLQVMENSVDPVHVEWAHGALFEFVMENQPGFKVAMSRKHQKIGFDEFEHGIIKRRLLVGQTEEDEDWRVGHPLLFPNTLSVGSKFNDFINYTLQIRVPMDDTHTMHYWYHSYKVPEKAGIPDHLLNGAPVYDVPIWDENGDYLLQYIHAQDIMNWVTQGPIADRTRENLGASDRGLVVYRRLLQREMERSERGEDPINVLRDEEMNHHIALPIELAREYVRESFEKLLRRHMTGFSPIADDLVRVIGGGAPVPQDELA